jgi:hypothetical protein
VGKNREVQVIHSQRSIRLEVREEESLDELLRRLGLPQRDDIEIIIIIIHLLGLAPAGYLTTPDNGPEGRLRGGASQVPNRETVVSLCH